MATEIYNPPKEVPVPTFSFSDREGSRKKEEQFLTDLKQWVKDKLHGGKEKEYIGEEIHFPVADGYARYMVASLKPVKLIHLPLGDAWNFEYAHKLNAKDVKEKIDGAKRIAEIWKQAK
jgi:hypothetical protein